jgi:hypothetical protein
MPRLRWKDPSPSENARYAGKIMARHWRNVRPKQYGRIESPNPPLSPFIVLVQ